MNNKYKWIYWKRVTCKCFASQGDISPFRVFQNDWITFNQTFHPNPIDCDVKRHRCGVEGNANGVPEWWKQLQAFIPIKIVAIHIDLKCCWMLTQKIHLKLSFTCRKIRDPNSKAHLNHIFVIYYSISTVKYERICNVTLIKITKWKSVVTVITSAQSDLSKSDYNCTW